MAHGGSGMFTSSTHSSSVAVSFSVWCDGGLGKQRMEEGGSSCVAVGFFFRSFCFVLIRGNYCVLPEYQKCVLPPLTLMVGPTN